MEELDVRWKQRFSNFEKAFDKFTQYIKQTTFTELEIQGLIQCFEYTFELAWKTIKDYLESKGEIVKFPRDTIQMAFQSGLITNGHTWLDALDKRNIMSHTYDEKNVEEAYGLITSEYYSIIRELYDKFKRLCNMKYGISEEDLSYIVNTINKFKEIEKVLIFGSRVKGNYKEGSDIDLAIVGEKVTFDTVSKLRSMLTDTSPVPYLFDIIDYTHLSNNDLKEHIDRIGQCIYKD